MRALALGSIASGTGKSFIAAHLAQALARHGARTCLIDLNLVAGDLHLAFGLTGKRCGVLDVLQGRCSSLAQAMVPVSGSERLWLIGGAQETLRPSSLATQEVERLTSGLRALPVEVAVLDLGAGSSQPLLDLFLAADLPLVIATPTPDSLRDAARYVRLARLRRGARGNSSSRSQGRPKVYTSLDDLVRDMNAIREEQLGGGSRFRPALVLNRGEEPNDDLARRWRRDYELDMPVIAAIPELRGDQHVASAPEPLGIDAGEEVAAAIDLLAATVWAELGSSPDPGASEPVEVGPLEPALR